MTKRRSKEVVTIRTAKAIESVLDAETRIILSESVRNHRETRTKELLLEVLKVIAVRKMMRRLKDKLVLKDQASSDVHSESSYFSDENSSIDDFTLDKWFKGHQRTMIKEHLLKSMDDNGEDEVKRLKNETCLVAQAPDGHIPRSG
ncbi:hypothetical protein Tco_1523852 [Tanacetum coccineum]